MIIDTSVLIASLTSPKQLLPALRERLEHGERLLVPTVVFFEWWRGPRLEQELAIQETLLPRHAAVEFGIEEAAVAARIYRQVQRGRGREIDLAIAACAIARETPLWTLNRKDFADVPGLKLV